MALSDPEASARRKARIFVLACGLNFIAFWTVAACIGAAANGKIEAGRYFLGNHGYYTEVSRLVYWYSWVHMALAVLGLPLAAVAGLGWLSNPEPKPDNNVVSGDRSEKSKGTGTGQ